MAQYAISYGIVIWVVLGVLTTLLYFEILTPQKITCIVLAIYSI